MAATTPLTGSELIDCARANSSKGLKVTAERCGYGNDTLSFETALQQAGEHIGVTIASFEDLVKPPSDRQDEGMEVAPDSLSQL
ncbi:hypothetical protein [Pantanalinema sp. GBBB05]|uniref:hypothetical protein n=1 Tax=Pantanalinema sp. GBBB05 TaxID=2604139 RepID=UPI001DDD9E9D|nr:hypothetical protein [Pantanalinema sp. GBBB05]